jgi:hypothetical protein
MKKTTFRSILKYISQIVIITGASVFCVVQTLGAVIDGATISLPDLPISLPDTNDLGIPSDLNAPIDLGIPPDPNASHRSGYSF